MNKKELNIEKVIKESINDKVQAEKEQYAEKFARWYGRKEDTRRGLGRDTAEIDMVINFEQFKKESV